MTYVKRRLWYHTPNSEREELDEDDLLSRTEPLVILGEPGMGKSKLLQNLAEAAALPWCTARRLINRPDPRSLTGDRAPIVIDALDEVAAKREGDAIDLVLQTLGTLDYPRFILSCRVADWKAATSAEAIREQYRDAPLQLHLKPLDHREQLAILAAEIGNQRAEVLIEHFERYGLDFLGNPQTLDLIARLPPDRPLPTGRGALFEQAIDTLRVEHRNTRGGSELACDAALDAAGAAFAGLILSGSANIVRHGSANLVEGDLQIAEVEEFDDGNVARVINTRLFAGGDDSFTYWHRRVGEYLGAAWLAKRADTPAKRRRLLQLFHAQKLVPASLRGLHAWLARDPRLADPVIAADPVGVIEYGDADTLTPQQSRAMLTALQRVTGENPAFWMPGARARALVSSVPHNELDLLLRNKSAASGLRALLVEQLSDVALAQSFRKTLRDVLLDSKELFGIRLQAGDALANLNGEDWPKLIDDLRVQGDTEAKRLAFELMRAIGCPSFSDTQIVEVVLAYDGLTACPWPKRSDDGLVVRFWRFADGVPVDRLDGLLETLTAYVRELLPEHPGIEEHDLIGLAYKLILRRLEAGQVESLRLWTWLSRYGDYRSEDGGRVEDWIKAHDDVRRAIYRSVILDGSEKPIWKKVSRLQRVSAGLTPNEGDVVALLGALDPADRGDMRWRDVLQLIPHDGQTGAAAREAAKPFVAHDAQLRNWLERLAEPRVPDWKVKQETKARQRAAKRAAQFAEHRHDFLANLKAIRTGEFRYVYHLTLAYLKLFQDIGDDCAPHERVAKWVGNDVAEAAHRGFEAFLTRQPVNPSAKRIAVLAANGRRFNAGRVIVAAFAERVRTRADPFADLPVERLMAGIFELWNSGIEDHAGLPNLRERIESELRKGGAWEAALRLYLTPQLKRRVRHVEPLYSLMRSEADAALAVGLAAEWLRSCPNLAAEAEEELIDRLLHSPRRAELRDIGDARRANAADDERRRNWDALQVLVDFEAASARLNEKIEPALLWHIRARVEGISASLSERRSRYARPRSYGSSPPSGSCGPRKATVAARHGATQILGTRPSTCGAWSHA